MRSDLHNLPNDSSSGSSSPHSNTSHEEPLEMDQASNMLHQKVVYNFSIPEFINHERIDRDDRERSRAEVRRKRNRLARHQQQHPPQDQRDSEEQSEDREPSERIEIQDSPVIVHATKKRRRAAAAVEEDDGDDDCHRRRQHVPVIDLTGDHDSPHSDTEGRTNSRSSLYRPYRDRHGFGQLFSDFERSHYLSRDRHERLNRFFYRSPSMQRLHRMQQLRRRHETHRHSHRLAGEDILFPERSVRENERTTNEEPHEGTNADDSVLIVNEVRGTTDLSRPTLEDDEPTFPPNLSSRPDPMQPPHGPHSSLDLIEDRLRILRERRQMHEAMTRVNPIDSVREREEIAQPSSGVHERMGLRNRNRPTNNNRESNEGTANESRANEEEQRPRENLRQSERNMTARMTASDNLNQEAADNGGEVEFIGEWNVRNSPASRQRHIPPSLLPFQLGHPLHLPFASSEHRHHFLRFLPTVTPPRLHHLYQENYEALLNLADTLGPGKPRGLDKTEIERIPSFRFSSNTAKETNVKCVVCISEYTNREKLRRLPCSHDFHAKCIDKWLKSNKTCPVCRDEVKVTSAE